MAAGSVHCVVTSPPYWGLRDYGVAGQLGLEASPDAYVAEMVDVFREVWRVLRDDGTLWLNLGDTYASDGGHSKVGATSQRIGRSNIEVQNAQRGFRPGNQIADIKTKDLVGLPWMVAFALRADGWYLRQDIIWSKPNPMPESVTDRPTTAHEHVFLLTKRPKYYYDAAAIAEEWSPNSHARLSQNVEAQVGSFRANGGSKTNGPMKAIGKGKVAEAGSGIKYNGSFNEAVSVRQTTRNSRSVWTITTHPFTEAHFATFPPALAERCIKAGSKIGDTILDPFAGAFTTALAADRLQRNAIGIELNGEYCEIARRRLLKDAPLLTELAKLPRIRPRLFE